MFSFSDLQKKYIPLKDRGDWDDIQPVPQFSSNVDVLQINYSQEYGDLSGYFRAVLQSGEISDRVFRLTEEIIKENASNYMAWYIRRKCIESLKVDYQEELIWLNKVGIANQKNYQIWHHRKIVLELSENPKYEKEFLGEVFLHEPKNFHAWCHRIWVVRRFGLYDGELSFLRKMLDEDCRNNSAWNFRFFLLTNMCEKITKEILTEELKFCFKYLSQIPKNESPYNYIKGFFQDIKIIKDFKCFAEFPEIKKEILKLYEEDKDNHHALSFLLDIYSEEKDSTKCIEACETLQKIDYIRRKYWEWRKVKFTKH